MHLETSVTGRVQFFCGKTAVSVPNLMFPGISRRRQACTKTDLQ